MEWVKINGFSRYEITREGIIRNAKTKKLMSLCKDKTGYLRVYLINDEGNRKALFAHRLVALTFVASDVNCPYVNHKDMNKENNHFSNLEWVSHKENIKHARNNKEWEYPTLKRNKAIKLLKDNFTTYELADIFNLSQPRIVSIVNK